MPVTEEIDRGALIQKRDPRPTQFAHIVLRTPPERVKVVADFYRYLLNARTTFINDKLEFMTYDDEHHRLAIIGVEGLTPTTRKISGLEHFSFTYATLGEVLAVYKLMKARDVAPAWTINHGFTTSIYYADPDGNLVEIQFDNLTHDEADVFMQSAYFDKNPIGVDFDPEKLIQRYENGDSIHELVKFRAALYEEGVVAPRPEGVPEYDSRGELIDAL